jgi:hypothetical protein
MDVRWQEPPPAIEPPEAARNATMARSRALNELAATLREHPGRWALVTVRRWSGGGDQYKRRGLEVTSRRRPDGLFDQYVRAPE